jgi:hypothetical protein
LYFSARQKGYSEVKDDMGEYQETCHEENLCGFPPFALFNYLLSKEKHNKERICTKGVGWRGLYQKTDLRKRPTIIIACSGNSMHSLRLLLLSCKRCFLLPTLILSTAPPGRDGSGRVRYSFELLII